MSNRSHVETVAWKIHVPTDLALRVESRIYDPTKGKPRYGQRNAIVLALLERYDKETPLPDWLQDGKIFPSITPAPPLPEPQA